MEEEKLMVTSKREVLLKGREKLKLECGRSLYSSHRKVTGRF